MDTHKPEFVLMKRFNKHYFIFSICLHFTFSDCTNWSECNNKLRATFDNYLASVDESSYIYDCSYIQLLMNLESVDETNNFVTIKTGGMFYFQTGLTWNPANYSDIGYLLYNLNSVLPAKWNVIQSSNEIVDVSVPVAYDMKLWVIHVGSVYMRVVPISQIKFICLLNPRYWPNHVQICSWTQQFTFPSGAPMKLNNSTCQYFNFKDVNPTWKILGCSSEFTVRYDYRTNEIQVTWYYLLEPYPTSMILTGVLPATMLAMTLPIIFLLPPSADNRADVGVALLLSNIVTLTSLFSSMPRSQTTPIFFWFALSSVSANIIAIVSAIIISKQKCGIRAKNLNKVALCVFSTLISVVTIALFLLLALAPKPVCGETSCYFEGRTFKLYADT